MVFSSLSFIVLFLPALLLCYFVLPKKGHARQYVLLLFSLIFYGSGEPLYIFLILACVSATWLLSGRVTGKSRGATVLALLVNIIPLLVTKYAGFAVRNVNAVFGLNLRFPAVVMPIGISFYTFQVITYIVDLYRGKIRQQKNIFLFALYIMFFPQLIAGPIVQYPEVEKQLESPDVSWDRIRYGAGRFASGLGKKVLLANQAGYIASTILNSGADSLSTGMTWLCVAAYTVQIYFDFSGYSEMAIGLGAIFGFHFPENFNDPYTSLSVTDFWRRWHMTLGRFFREYVYIPLGGNRVRKARWVFNMLVVWMLTGLWHGASWNFIIWGLYYGLLIIAERTVFARVKLPGPLAWILTMFLVVFGWAVFLCDGFSAKEMVTFLGGLFTAHAGSAKITVSSLRLWGYLPFLAVGFAVSTPAWSWLRNRVLPEQKKESRLYGILHDAFLVAVFLASLLFLIGSTYNPFIYFRF